MRIGAAKNGILRWTSSAASAAARVITAGGTLACLSPCALAAGVEASLETVVVTATQTATSVSDAPAAVSVITSEDLSDRNSERFTDALQGVPGLFLNSDGNGQSAVMTGGGGFSLRGMNSKQTAVLVNGIPMGDGFGNVDFRTMLVDDVERIEVVPGASSSLYGSNAIGGVINVITKDPEQSEISVRAKKTWKIGNGDEIDLYYRNKFDKLGVVVGYGYQETTGYANNLVETYGLAPGNTGTPVTGAIPTVTNSGTPTFIVGDNGAQPWHQINGVLRFTYDLTSQDKVHLGASVNKFYTGYSPYDIYVRDAAGNVVSDSAASLTANGQMFSMPGDYAFSFSPGPAEQGDVRIDAGYDGDLGKGAKVKVDIAHSTKTYDYTSLNYGSAWTNGSGTLTEAPGDSLDLIAQASFPLGSMQTIVEGFSLHNSTLEQPVYNETNWHDPASKTTETSRFSGVSDGIAFYVQDEVRLLDAFKVYVGGRLDSWKSQGDYWNGSVDQQFGRHSASAFSPKISAVWDATSELSVRASVGRSFRAPTVYELFGNSFCCGGYYGIGNPNLSPETATSYELGTDWRLASRTKLTATIYQTTVKNLIYQHSVSGTGPTAGNTYNTQENAGVARVRGLELTLASKPTRWFEARASYSHINSEVLENPAELDTVGKRLQNTPRNMASASLRVRSGPWNGLLETKYTGQAYALSNNSDSAPGVFGSTDGETLTNLKVSYQFTSYLRGSLAANNLTNRTYYEYYLMPGRNYTAELSVLF